LTATKRSVAVSTAGTTATRFTLRAKGLLAFAALALYLGALGYTLKHERTELLRMASELEQMYAHENALAKASYALGHSIYKLQEHFFSSDSRPTSEDEIALDVELIQSGLQGLLAYQPEITPSIESLNQYMAKTRPSTSRSSLIELRDAERTLEAQLDRLARQLHERRDRLWNRYREVNDSVSVIVAISGLLGAVFFGTALTLFLTRLTWDIRKVAERAVNVASGDRGAPLEVTRHDEVGDLMRAVNSMQSRLHIWEQQMELARQQQFHREKMAAIGSLAAAVAHEINNPIAAIAGLALSMKGAGQTAAGAGGSEPLDLIVQQTKRISTISRQIAELTAPHSPEPELLDLNSLVRNTCGFVGYDKRFRSIDMALELDLNIPAIKAIADHLTQVLMNLLINAADALENAPEHKPKISVATRAGEGEVAIEVTDNGSGMNETVLAHAFEESFTTKPPDKGRGLGLFLCKSLIEGCGNRIELESTLGVGTTARIRLMLAQQPGV